MRLILNVIWLVLCGIWLAIAYVLAGIVACILIITIPFGIAAFRIASYVLWPFGRTTVPRQDAGIGSLIGNIFWIILFGWWLALGHLISGIALCITIIGIPLGLANFKLIPISLLPLGVRIVDSDEVGSAVRGVAIGRRRRGSLERADGGDPDDGLACVVRAAQIHLGGEPPVVVARRVVEDLAHPPDVRVGVVDDQHRGPASVGARADLAVLGEVGLQGIGPRVRVPARLLVELAELVPPAQRGEFHPAEQGVAHQNAERADVAGHRRRPLVQLIGRGIASAASGFARRSHSSSRLESTCLTISPSHSIRSVSSSVLASSGTVWRSAL